MVIQAIDVVHEFAKNAYPNYVQAFEQGGTLLAEKAINTPLRLAHFMAQCFAETGALTLLVENGNYTAKNLAKMWDDGNWHKYFESRAACIAMAEQCAKDHGVALFNLVYGGRMGNGPPSSGDGWRYRGHGILQTTGRKSYREFGKKCQVDFEGDPNLVATAEHALKPALAEWGANNLNIAADKNDIAVITYGINGGYNGLPDRKAWFAAIHPFVTGGVPVQKSIEWRVQQALNMAGFDCGKPDGVIGAATRKAIIACRVSRGLSPGNQISDDLLQSLGL